jgi:hypothetical protein
VWVATPAADAGAVSAVKVSLRNRATVPAAWRDSVLLDVSRLRPALSWTNGKG